ncbi:MAG TPA: lysozyme inhibitor LprI family protein [Verrucomicrobiae bacterium]|nr:lysozyme inhibitor LprI family protein [Verrucomicrobiae bacterium]
MRLCFAALLLFATLPATAANCPTTLPQDRLNDCWVKAADVANARLDDLLRELKPALGKRHWAHLKESQSYWEDSRSIDCKVEASLIEGPVREAVRYGCTEKRAIERMRQLRFLLCPQYNLDGRCEAARRYE